MADNAQSIQSIVPGKRYNVSGVLCDLKQSKYRDDTKNIISFSIEDNTAKLRCVGFDEAHAQLFTLLKDGTSYRLKNVNINTKEDGSNEAKIFKDTKIDIITDIELHHNIIQMPQELQQMQNQRVQITLYVHNVDKSFTLKNSDTTSTKITAFHHMHHLPIIVVLNGNAKHMEIQTYQHYTFKGKCTQMGWIFTNQIPTHYQQETQENIQKCKHNATQNTQITKVEDVQTIQNMQIGQIVQFKATVKAAEIQTSITKKGKKRTITLQDNKKNIIEYTLFDKKAEEYNTNIGNTVLIQAQIANFEGNTCLYDAPTFRES